MNPLIGKHYLQKNGKNFCPIPFQLHENETPIYFGILPPPILPEVENAVSDDEEDIALASQIEDVKCDSQCLLL